MTISVSTHDFLAMRWITYNFLQSRKLEAPDRRPLFAYRCTRAELDQLLALLKPAMAVGPGADGRHVAALFCLAGAELWKWEYAGGPWRWQFLCDRIGMPNDYGRIQALAGDGLQFWQRPLRRGGAGRLFLLSLVLEGGFPLHLLQGDGNHLTAYLNRVLSDLSRFGADGEAAERIAARHAAMLPASLRNEELYSLVADMLGRFLGYRDLLPASVAPKDAIEWLDGHCPRWRDSLPLTVDDEAAKRLLAGLVEETVRMARDRTRVLTILCHRLLRLRGDAWWPSVVLDVAGDVASECFPEEIRARLAATGAMRARLMPAGALERRLSAPLAVVRLPQPSAAGRSWTIEPLSGADGEVPLPLTDPIEATVIVNGVEVGRCALPGGEAATQGPWVFEADSQDDAGTTPDGLTFIGCGSVRTRRPSLYVACPADAGAPVADGGGTVECVGRLADGAALYRVSGAVRCRRPGQALPVLLRTGAADEAASRILVRGRPPGWQLDGVGAVLGDGTVIEMTADGRIGRPRPGELLWRKAMPGSAWAQLPAIGWPRGLIEIALVRDGGVIDHTRVAVLPAGAELLITGTAAAAGTLTFRGFQGARILLDQAGLPKGTTTDILAEADGACVRIDCPTAPPADLDVLIDGDGLPGYGGGPVPMTLPFPARGSGFIGPDGHWLPHNETVALDMLYGVRARVSGSLHGQGQLFGYLATRGHDLRQAKLHSRFTRELPLSTLRDGFARLLASDGAIDDCVVLSVTGSGPERSLRIRRFDVALSVAEGANEGERVLGMKVSQPLPVDGLEVVCKPLTDLAGPETALPPAPSAEAQPSWAFRAEDIAPGCWLIYGRIERRHRVRPIMRAVAGPADDGEGEVTSRLRTCIAMADHHERRAALWSRLQAMARDPLDPDWPELAGIRRALQDNLPLSTLDLFDLLAGEPAALAMGLALSGGAEVDAVLRMESELPFTWALLPIATLYDAFVAVRDARARDFAERGLGDGARPLADRSILDTLRRIADTNGALEMTCTLVRGARGLSAPGEPAAAQYALAPVCASVRDGLVEARRLLLEAHRDEPHWPHALDFRAERLKVPLPAVFADEHPAPRSFLDAPFAAAIIAWTGVAVGPDVRHALQFCRDFDPAWFESAYPRALALLSQPPHSFEV